MTLIKKLCLSVDDKIRTWTVSINFIRNLNTSFFFKWKKQKLITSSFIKVTEYNISQKKFESDCYYCRKHDHKELNCLKKKSDIFSEKSQFISHITDSNRVVNLTFSYEPSKITAKTNKMKSIITVIRRRLWLVIHLTERSVIAVLNSVSDLNLIYKNISESLISVFKILSLQHTEDQLLQTYSIYHKKMKVKDLFRDWKQTHESFTSANLDMSLILRLLWLWQNNLKVDFINLTVQWRTVTEDSQLSSFSENNLWDSLMRKLKDLQMNYIMQRLQVIDLKDQKSLSALISEVYCKLTEIFSKAQTETLSLYCEENHAIELLKRTTLSFESMYNLSVKELKVLQQYLNVNLKNEFIQPSQSSAEASVLFTLKSDRGLWLCINYQRLNTIIKKNQYFLSLIDKIMNCVSDAKIFTKIDVKNIYYHICICEDNEWKTVFHTHYRLYKYLIMSFRLINSSVSFQSYIHKVLYEYLNIFVIVFLDNILIYSMKESKHEQYMQTVL